MIFGDEIILENQIARLEPLRQEHVEDLWQEAKNPDIWQFQPRDVSNKEQWTAHLRQALDMKAAEQRYPFLITDLRNQTIAGSTSYGNFSLVDRRVEIGWTWLGSQFQGTGLNKACKFLLLSFAFEKMAMHRVELKTDVNNLRSRAAIKGLGATEEGILRSHMTIQGGQRRDTVYYSILAEEWPAVRKHLLNAISDIRVG